VPDGHGLHWSGAQQAMLRELGCELFVMRAAVSATPAHAAAAPRAADAVPLVRPAAGPMREERSRDDMGPDAPPVSRAPRGGGAARARRVMLAPDAGVLRGPQAALARALLAALGVHEAEVRGEATPGLPAILFGDAGIDSGDALRAPSLAALRDGRAKRALWPALRALRKRLRGAGGA
jgi:hypothetical protein